MFSLALTTAGCANLPPELGGPQPPAEMLVETLGADQRQLEAQLASASQEPPSPASDLRVALLQSVPGYNGSNRSAAEIRLNALAQNAPPEIAAVAKARLNELRRGAECQSEVRVLKDRVEKLVDIERKSNTTTGPSS